MGWGWTNVTDMVYDEIQCLNEMTAYNELQC